MGEAADWGGLIVKRQRIRRRRGWPARSCHCMESLNSLRRIEKPENRRRNAFYYIATP
jgi:hypothetical protein